jgi:hypothetical protein
VPCIGCAYTYLLSASLLDPGLTSTSYTGTMVKKSVLGGYHKSVGFQAGSQLDFSKCCEIFKNFESNCSHFE